MPTLESKLKQAKALLQKNTQQKPRLARQPRTRDSYPLSDEQRRVWHHMQYANQPAIYNILLGMQLEDDLDVDKFSRCAAALLQAHEILRTVFLNDGPVVVQKVIPTLLPAIQTCKLESETSFSQYIQKEVRTPFDLTRGPLIKFYVIAMPEGCRLIVIVHHLIADGISLNLLINQLLLAYQSGDTQPLLQLSADIAYLDYLMWQQTQSSSPVYQQQVKFWKQKLKGVMPLCFGVKTPPSRKSYFGNRLSIHFGLDAIKGIRRLCAQHDITLSDYYLTIYALMLYKYTLSKKFVIGVVASNRSLSEFQAILGFMANTLPCVFDMTQKQLLQELFLQVKNSVREAYDNGSVAYEDILKSISYQGTEFVKALYIVRKLDIASHTSVKPLDLYNRVALFDLMLTVESYDEGCLLNVDYSVDVFSKKCMTDFIAEFKSIIEASANADVTVGDILQSLPQKKLSLYVCSNNRKTKLACELEGLLATLKIPAHIDSLRVGGLASLDFEPNAIVLIDLTEMTTLESVCHYLSTYFAKLRFSRCWCCILNESLAGYDTELNEALKAYWPVDRQPGLFYVSDSLMSVDVLGHCLGAVVPTFDTILLDATLIDTVDATLKVRFARSSQKVAYYHQVEGRVIVDAVESCQTPLAQFFASGRLLVVSSSFEATTLFTQLGGNAAIYTYTDQGYAQYVGVLCAFLLQSAPLALSADNLSFLQAVLGGGSNTRFHALVENEVAKLDSTAICEGVYDSRRETEIKDKLLAIFSQYLEVESLKEEDNYFYYGINSIKGLGVAMAISEAFSVDCQLEAIFSSKTITTLARLIYTWTRGDVTASVIERKDLIEYPMTIQQRRLWMLHRIDPESCAYNFSVSLTLQGKLNVSAVKGALNGLLRRYDVFQQRFLLKQNDAYVSVSTEHIQTPLETQYQLEAELDALMQAVNKPFALSQGEAPYRIIINSTSPTAMDIFIGFHHIIIDAWSLNLLMKAFMRLYTSGDSGLASPSTALLRYVDYAQKALQLSQQCSELSVWKSMLQGCKPLQLPFDNPSQTSLEMCSDVVYFTIDADVAEQLSAQCVAQSMTPFSVYFSLYVMALGLICDEDDILLTLPVANRHLPGTESMVGYFVNLVLFRCCLDRGLTLQEMASQIYSTFVKTQRYQHVPYESILKDNNLDAEFSSQSFIQASFNYIDLPKQCHQIDDVTITVKESRPVASKFNINFIVECYQGQYRFVVEYNRNLFNKSTIEQLFKIYTDMIGLYLDPKRRTLQECYNTLSLNLYPKTPQAPSVVGFESQEVYAYLVKHAQQMPTKIALKCHSSQVDYASLLRAVEGKAAALLSVGATRLGVYLSDPIESVIIMLACLAAKITYVPLSLYYSEGELRAIVDDALIDTLIVDAMLFANVPRDYPGSVHHFDELSVDGNFVGVSDVGQSVAYILYTSGTTGKPKGVMQSQAHMHQHMVNYIQNLGLSSSDTLLQLSPNVFDASLMDLYSSLLLGAELYIYDVKREGTGSIIDTLNTQRVTVYHSTPSLYRHVFSRAALKDNPWLRYVVLGGEAVNYADFALYQTVFSDKVRFVNGYGPSECTVAMQNIVSHEKHFFSDTDLQAKTIPLGRCVADTQILLVNKQRTGFCLNGEIALKSENLFLGYWNQDAEVKKAIAGVNGLYLTGDRARLLSTGEYLYLGRTDHMIKHNGRKVNTALIQQTLLDSALIAQAHVMLVESKGRTALVAFITSATENNDLCATLRAVVAKKLPDYCVPNEWVVLADIPLTLNGKVDRRKLKSTFSKQPKQTKALQLSPENTIEAALCALCVELLGKPVNTHMNYFDVGFDSLMVLQLHALICKTLKVRLQPVDLYKYPTIKRTADYLRTQDAHSSVAEKVSENARLSEGSRRAIFNKFAKLKRTD
jgi:non-ribosomal peptide synthetase component F/acyl carrier protein